MQLVPRLRRGRLLLNWHIVCGQFLRRLHPPGRTLVWSSYESAFATFCVLALPLSFFLTLVMYKHHKSFGILLRTSVRFAPASFSLVGHQVSSFFFSSFFTFQQCVSTQC